MNWRYECHSVVSSRRSEPPHRTLAWLSQCVSTAQRDAERRWTAETASSLGVVGVRRCMVERKSTEPCAWWPLFYTGWNKLTNGRTDVGWFAKYFINSWNSGFTERHWTKWKQRDSCSQHEHRMTLCFLTRSVLKYWQSAALPCSCWAIDRISFCRGSKG